MFPAGSLNQAIPDVKLQQWLGRSDVELLDLQPEHLAIELLRLLEVAHGEAAVCLARVEHVRSSLSSSPVETPLEAETHRSKEPPTLPFRRFSLRNARIGA